MVPAELALEELRDGNQRYMYDIGREARASVRVAWRRDLASKGQNPMAAVLGCADSRVPVESIFDAKPGDLFVLRNAGNTCTHGEGSIVGSLEFAVEYLQTKLVVVMGHTKCGAIAGATRAMKGLQEAGYKFEEEHCRDQHEYGHRHSNRRGYTHRVEPSSDLEGLLLDLAPVAAEAAASLPKDASIETITALTVHLNVFRTIDCMLTHSSLLRERVRQGDVMMIGAVYDIGSGQVHFLGDSPNQQTILE